jgi:hypothetical protein
VKKMILGCLVVFLGLFFVNYSSADVSVSGNYRLNETALRAQLKAAGYVAVPGPSDFFGVPCIKVCWLPGMKVKNLCDRLSILKSVIPSSPEFILRYNHIFPDYALHEPKKIKWLVIPLNADWPKVLPFHEKIFEGNEDGTLVFNLAKGWAAFYSGADCIYQFPFDNSDPKNLPAKAEGTISGVANYLPLNVDPRNFISVVVLGNISLYDDWWTGEPPRGGDIRCWPGDLRMIFPWTVPDQTRYVIQ